MSKTHEKEFCPTGIISIIDPGSSYVDFKTNEESILRLCFKDICFKTTQEDLLPPTREHIVDILNWSLSNIDFDSRILVHCFAGVSRSSAAAIISMIPLLGMKEAVRRVSEFDFFISKDIYEKGSFWFMPNNLMIQIADNELNLGGELVKLTQSSFSY